MCSGQDGVRVGDDDAVGALLDLAQAVLLPDGCLRNDVVECWGAVAPDRRAEGHPDEPDHRSRRQALQCHLHLAGLAGRKCPAGLAEGSERAGKILRGRVGWGVHPAARRERQRKENRGQETNQLQHDGIVARRRHAAKSGGRTRAGDAILRGMMKRLLPVVAVLSILGPASQAAAEVTRVDVKTRAEIGGSGFEKIVGIAHFEVDPKDPRNRVIADIDKAPVNAAGRVEFSGGPLHHPARATPRSRTTSRSSRSSIAAARLIVNGFKRGGSNDPARTRIWATGSCSIAASRWCGSAGSSTSGVRTA